MTERLCLPVEDWPVKDRNLWRRATVSGGLLDDDGLAADWRPDTICKVSMSYGRFIRFLQDSNFLNVDDTPDQRARKEVVGRYVEHLRAQVAPKTLAGRITDLAEAIRVMCPGTDIGFLKRLARRLERAVVPVRAKHHRLLPIEDLYQLGFNLMQTAHDKRGPRPCSSSVQFRDGLMIALLAARPFRLRTFSKLRTGHHLKRTNDGFLLHILAEDNKGKKEDIYPLPGDLTKWLDLYLEQIRPRLLKNRVSDRLWISWEGRDLSECGVHDKIEERTNAAFGHAINPHLFRDCAATSIAINDPECVRIIRSILGHNTLMAGERFYNQARSLSAQRNLISTIQRKRQGFVKSENQRKAR
jgi:integrase/recombinase XerD